jgi:hypothetical protein
MNSIPQYTAIYLAHCWPHSTLNRTTQLQRVTVLGLHSKQPVTQEMTSNVLALLISTIRFPPNYGNWHLQGRIKGFVGPRHFPLLGSFGDSKSIAGTAVYSRLSGLMEGERMYELLRNTDNPNFIFYTPTAPLARSRLRNVLFSYIHSQVGLLWNFDFWKKKSFF